jgi:hypothetical protein
MSRRSTLPLISIAALACALAACKGEKPVEPAKPAATSPAAAPARTKEQAMSEIMEIPEIKELAARIEKSSQGKSHGAVMEDDPQPRLVNGKPYWQLSFVENRPDRAQRLQSFLVAKDSNDILVEDPENDELMSLRQWRRNVHRVEIRAAQ